MSLIFLMPFCLSTELASLTSNRLSQIQHFSINLGSLLKRHVFHTDANDRVLDR